MPLRLTVDAAEGARMIQTLGGQGIEVANIVEVAIQDGTVMLRGSDQHGRPAAEKQVVRIVRMLCQRWFCCRSKGEPRTR